MKKAHVGGEKGYRCYVVQAADDQFKLWKQAAEVRPIVAELMHMRFPMNMHMRKMKMGSLKRNVRIAEKTNLRFDPELWDAPTLFGEGKCEKVLDIVRGTCEVETMKQVHASPLPLACLLSNLLQATCTCVCVCYGSTGRGTRT
eukprot:3985316-Prymnesium_polylepis.1